MIFRIILLFFIANLVCGFHICVIFNFVVRHSMTFISECVHIIVHSLKWYKNEYCETRIVFASLAHTNSNGSMEKIKLQLDKNSSIENYNKKRLFITWANECAAFVVISSFDWRHKLWIYSVLLVHSFMILIGQSIYYDDLSHVVVQNS